MVYEALAAGAFASAGDLIVARKIDHQFATDPGHTLANGDRFVVDAVTSPGLLVRRVLENEQRAERPVLYPSAKFATTDLGYAVTGHTGQGGTVTRGEAVFCGSEPREWAYVALTRGRDRNTARVVTQARAADPGAGTRADPELSRADLLRRERAALPPETAKADGDAREALAVLAGCLDRLAGEDSATEYQRKSLVRADHLGLLHARWADQVKTADGERYQRIVQEALPEEWRGQLSPQATWLYRTMKAAELAGLDAAEALQPAYRRIEARLAEAMDDRLAWEQITAGPRRLAVAADSEISRRNPDKRIEPIRSAEPRAPEHDEITKPQPEAKPVEPSEWATQLAEQRRAFQQKLEECQNVLIPDEDPDYGFVGHAWPQQERDPDAILQPPRPELRPCAGVERLAGYEMPEREAGS